MNSKNKKIVFVVFIALLVAVAGGVALYMYLVPKKTTIYVFRQNVPAGTVINADMLIPVQADSEIYVAGAKTDASERFVTGANIDAVLKSGDSLRMDVTEGMPLTLSLLTTSGGSTVEMTMNPEKIAITIPVSDVTGVTPELKPGSRVNVYATGLTDGQKTSTVLLFEGMRILSVNKNERSLTSVTIETSTEESLKLIYYASSCSMYLGLIDSSGYEFSGVNNPSFSGGIEQNTYEDPLPIEPSTEEIIEEEPIPSNEQPVEQTPVEQTPEEQTPEEQTEGGQ